MRLKFIFLSFLLFGLFARIGWAQANYLDRLARMPEDSTKVHYIKKLIDSLRERSSREALQLAVDGKSIAERIEYKRGIAYMLESIGWMHYRNSDLSEALRITTDALTKAREANDKSIEASCLISIAAIHFDQKQYHLAIEHFKKAAVISKQVNDVKTYGRSLNNIGFSLIQLQSYDSALYYSNLSYDIAKRANEFYILGFACRNLGEIATGEKNYTRAIAHYKEGLTLAESSSNNYLKISILYRLGAVYNLTNNPDQAIPILNQAIKLGKQYGYRDELERSLKLMADSYIMLDDATTAYAFQSEYIVLHDSLTDVRRLEQLSVAQARFDLELKQAQIEVLTRDAALQQESYERQRLFTYVSIGCASLFLIFMFVLLSNNAKIKGAKRIVDYRNAEIKKQTSLLRESNATKDKLFSIISHDLRSPLGGLKGLMELISREGLTQDEFIRVSKNLRKNIDSVYDDLDNLLHWAQAQLNGIKSNKGLFNVRDLVDEKMHLFEEVARNKQVALINAVDKDIFIHADINQLGLVIRNLLANAVKFSHANGRIEVVALQRGGTVEIEVSDTGVGMSSEEVERLFRTDTHFSKRGTNNEKGIGLGLLLSKEFIEGNGGRISVQSELGKGTTFTIVMKNQKSGREMSTMMV